MGTAVRTFTNTGYNGLVVLMVGVTPEETIRDIEVVQHKETPGLGAEISESFFYDQFLGKKIFDEGKMFTSVSVLKGGTSPDDPHAVDAISGGTITSVALQEMLFDCLGNYETYFKNKSISHE